MRLDIKTFQLWVHNNYSSIRTTLLVLFGTALLGLNTATLAKISHAQDAGKARGQTILALSQQNKDLSNQIKDLSQENKTLAEQNQQYQRCNFLAFALYTRTFTPIQDSQIDSCNTVLKELTSPKVPAQ